MKTDQAPYECGDPNCLECHCARCGEHAGAQGHLLGVCFVPSLKGPGNRFGLATFNLAPHEGRFDVAMSCAPEYLDMIRKHFAHTPWLEEALEIARTFQRPDRRREVA